MIIAISCGFMDKVPDDLHEMTNLIVNQEHQVAIEKLTDIYDWLESTGGMQIT